MASEERCVFEKLVSSIISREPIDNVRQILEASLRPRHGIAGSGIPVDPNKVVHLAHQNSGDRLVHVSARHGREDVLNLLHRYGGDFEAGNLDGKRPLHEAVLSSQLECVRCLLSFHVTIDCLKRADWTPLMLACTKPNLGVIMELVNAGADLNLNNKDGWTSFHIASREGHVSILSYLHSCNTLLSQTVSKNGRTPLHTAALHGRLAACQFLIANCNYLVDKEDSCGSTPLMDAARAGFMDVVDTIIHLHGADVRKCDVLGRQAIHLSSQAGYCGIVEYLVKKQNVSSNVPSRPSEQTPIHFAAKEGKVDAIHCLLQLEADINGQDTKGRTALHMAVGSQHFDSVSLLLKIGAKNISDMKGTKPSSLTNSTALKELFDAVT